MSEAIVATSHLAFALDIGDVYDLLVQQAGGQRMEALEITVVVLIALEIALAVLRHRDHAVQATQ